MARVWRRTEYRGTAPPLFYWCAGRDSNPHPEGLDPKSSASASFATRAGVGEYSAFFNFFQLSF